MSVSTDLNAKFQMHLKQENADLGVNFSVYVLQAGAWPLGQAAVTPFAVPHQLEKSVQMVHIFQISVFLLIMIIHLFDSLKHSTINVSTVEN